MANARVVRKQDLNYWFDLHNFKVIFEFFYVIIILNILIFTMPFNINRKKK